MRTITDGYVVHAQGHPGDIGNACPICGEYINLRGGFAECVLCGGVTEVLEGGWRTLIRGDESGPTCVASACELLSSVMWSPRDINAMEFISFLGITNTYVWGDGQEEVSKNVFREVPEPRIAMMAVTGCSALESRRLNPSVIGPFLVNGRGRSAEFRWCVLRISKRHREFIVITNNASK